MDHSRIPKSSAVVRAIARVSFSEIVRDKVLYNTVLIAMLIVSAGFLAGRISFLWTDRIVLDFGISALNLSGALLGILLGANALGREIEKRTLFVALSHPISKPQFILGKFLGITWVQAVNWSLLTLFTLAIVMPLAKDPVLIFGNTSLWAGLFYLLLQAFLMTAISVFFSTFTTPSLAVSFSIGVYLIGNNISEIQALALKNIPEASAEAWVIKMALNLLPNLQHFNLGTHVAYALPVTFGNFIFTTLYAVAATGVLLLLGGRLLQSREV